MNFILKKISTSFNAQMIKKKMNYFFISIFLIALPLCHTNPAEFIFTTNLDPTVVKQLKQIKEPLSFSIKGSIKKKIPIPLANGKIEEKIIIKPNEDRIVNINSSKAHFIGVADGTQGISTADLLASPAGPLINEYKGLTDLHSQCQTIQNKHLNEVKSSSTLNCLIKDTETKKKVIINVGDSRCYIIRSNRQLLRTNIHNATNKDEVYRMTLNKEMKFTDSEKKESKHFTYKKSNFQLSRAFGLQPKFIQECKPEPDIYKLKDNHEFAIIMSDGLENAGLKLAEDELPKSIKNPYSTNHLHGFFISSLINILISGETKTHMEEKIIEKFDKHDVDDKSMVFIPIHNL